MSEKYMRWIEENVQGTGYGKCVEATRAMADAFPELTRVRGHYHCPAWGKRAHWWMTSPDGAIIDPTVAQFPSRGEGAYEPWVDGSPEPTGKCMVCGEYAYNYAYFCSSECEDSEAKKLEPCQIRRIRAEREGG